MKSKLTGFSTAAALSCAALLPLLSSCARAPEAPPRVIDISADDSMKYSLTVFEVQRGQKVTINLKNTGTSPKASMGHNLVVLAKNVNWNKFVEHASMAAGEDYVPASLKKDVLAKTKLLGPNETDSVTFTAPALPGPYDFVCSFPGHATQGMKGVMTVTQ